MVILWGFGTKSRCISWRFYLGTFPSFDAISGQFGWIKSLIILKWKRKSLFLFYSVSVLSSITIASILWNRLNWGTKFLLSWVVQGWITRIITTYTRTLLRVFQKPISFLLTAGDILFLPACDTGWWANRLNLFSYRISFLWCLTIDSAILRCFSPLYLVWLIDALRGWRLRYLMLVVCIK